MSINLSAKQRKGSRSGSSKSRKHKEVKIVVEEDDEEEEDDPLNHSFEYFQDLDKVNQKRIRRTTDTFNHDQYI